MLYEKNQWIEDIDKVLEVLPELDRLAGKSILITGASGLICSSIIDILFRYNDTHKDRIIICAAGRNIVSMNKRFGSMTERDDFIFVPYDAVKTDNNIEIHADYIIHGASNAFPSKVMKEPVETMLSNIFGIKYLLDYARENGTNRLLYISSSEVYGQRTGNQPFQEDEYGYVDLLNPRNAYSVGKRAAETMCISYSKEYEVESVIVRPGHIYGPTASRQDTRVSSAWPFSVANGENIIMKSDGSQIRSYCYCLDCASAILKVLLCGNNCTAFNISNPNSIISIKELAETLVEVAGVKLIMELPTEQEKSAYNPMSNSSLESTSLLDIGWHGCFSPKEGLEHTVSLIKENYYQ